MINILSTKLKSLIIFKKLQMFYLFIIFIATTFKIIKAMDTLPPNTSDKDKQVFAVHNEIR